MTNTPPARAGLSAAILAGGESRRMGQDKALLRLAGRTLLERAIAAASAVADDVSIVGDRPAYHRFGVRVVPDRYPGAGALGGIATALHSARHDRVLIVACDMPFLSIELIHAMASVTDGYDVLLPVTDVLNLRQGGHGTYETLHAIYRRTCLPRIEQRIANGQLRAFELFVELRTVHLDEGWLRRYDPDLKSFVNTNNVEEWRAAVAQVEQHETTVEGRE